MQVSDDRCRNKVEEPYQMRRRPVERVERLERAHVADVLAHDRLIVAGQAERGLEFAANRENGRPAAGQSDRQRRVAAGAADRQRQTGHTSHDRVVARHVNLPIVHEEAVGERRES